MKCAKCGQDSPEGMSFCGKCGNALERPAVTQDAPRNRYCVTCGRVISWEANVCQYCGHDFRPKPPAKPAEGDQLVLGGILSILAGIVSILLVAAVNLDGSNMSNSEMLISSMLYLFAVLAVIGGLSSLARVSYTLSVFGAACGVFGLGFFFGIPALIFTARSPGEFERAPVPPA